MKEDRRVRRTIKTIEDVFLHMLKEKDIDQISVSQICQEADIVRKTFYLHYEDKYALLEKIMDDMIIQMKKVSAEKEKLTLLEGNIHWFAFLESKRDMLNILMTSSISSYFNHKLLALLKEEMKNKERYQFKEKLYNSEEILLEFLTSGVMGIMTNFIRISGTSSYDYGKEMTLLLNHYLICNVKENS